MIYSICIFLSLLSFISSQEQGTLSNCFYRCQAKCASGKNVDSSTVSNCQSLCGKYKDKDLCPPGDEGCFKVCRDLGAPSSIDIPNGIKIKEITGGTYNFSWNTVPGARFYVLQYKRTGERNEFGEDKQLITFNPNISNFSFPGDNFCLGGRIRVAAVAQFGLSEFSEDVDVESPEPQIIDPMMKVIELRYENVPIKDDFYEANGTIVLTFQYDPPVWPLGASDIEVTPLFHMINCETPDLEQTVPVPLFYPGPEPNTLQSRFGSDMMTRRCRFVYYMQSARSKKCSTTAEMRNPSIEALQTLEINCDTVTDSPCDKTEMYPGPLCGQTNGGNYTILGNIPKVSDNANLTVNYTFVMNNARMNTPFKYFVAFYGPAKDFKMSTDAEFLGVNLTSVIGEISTCLQWSNEGDCVNSTGQSLVIPGLHWDTLYGVMVCAVRDIRNTTFPGIGGGRARQLRAEKLIVDSKVFRSDHTGLIVGLVVGGLVLLIILVTAGCLYKNKQTKIENKRYQLKLAQMERDKENRYTDFPKKQDIWEIERRNLVIYNETKLGSGAFGAVYLGKLIGKSLAHKDANSPLGINLLRTENCEVAVKMLPEFADDMSRSEFLREISLMKSLGYHERLVNMLACVTETEPLCLVVEYCNDGDLLQFLKERCKYMMKLDELNINYREPMEEDEFDEEMILTMKQLLMFAVQISFGLEYLSQKGFVHRDVAARNILVNNKKSVKIGDFGLCRYIYADSTNYKSKGGRLPLKWMSPEAIRHYEFSTKSDVWSFGILLFEIITLGGSPYPSVQPDDMLEHLESGGRMERADNCPDEYYEVMTSCWALNPSERPEFSGLRQKLASQLEEVTEEYSYLQLDANKDYYNVTYADTPRIDTIVIPESKVTVTDAPEEYTKDSLSREHSVSLDSLPLEEDNESNWKKEGAGVDNPAFIDSKV